MHATVRARFVPWTAPLEGLVAWLYLDVKGLVTTATGILVDPIELVRGLPFVRADGTPATPAQIDLAWRTVKAATWLAHAGAHAAASVTSLRLTPEGIEEVTLAKLDVFANILLHRFPEFDLWPDDAQLATLGIAWAFGPSFHLPALDAALRAHDWRAASTAWPTEALNANRNEATRALYLSAVATTPTDPAPAPVDIDTVRDVQHALNELGFGPLTVDGVAGSHTVAAVAAFQRAHPPLTVDGDAGPRTRAVLVDSLLAR